MFIPHLKPRSFHLRPWEESPEGYFYTSPNPERWAPGNEHNQCVGADLTSGTTIAPTHRIHYVLGTGAVVNITVPWATFAGEIILIPDAAFTWTAAGNIAVAGTAVIGRPVHLTYHPAKGKWYTHAIA